MTDPQSSKDIVARLRTPRTTVGPDVSPEEATNEIERTRAALHDAEERAKALHADVREWIAANGPGGWIDNLRKRSAHETSRDGWVWKYGVIHFHAIPGFAERLRHIIEDCREAGVIADIWLNDFGQVLKEFGYRMTITHPYVTAPEPSLKQSPPRSAQETAERRDYAAVRDAHDRTVEELERYKKALYTANGFLIQRGWEPVKLEYSEGNACPDCQGHGWRRRAFTADDAGECPTCAGSGRLGGAKLTVAVEPKSTAIPDCEPGCDCDFCHAPPVKALPARFECTCLPSGRETCRAGGPPFWTMCKTCGGAVNGKGDSSD